MKYVKTSRRKIVKAVRKAILSKLESNSGNLITITVKRVTAVLGIDSHVARTEVGRVLARLEKLGYLRRHNRGRPAKYLVTGKGLRWAKKRESTLKCLISYPGSRWDLARRRGENL